MRGTAGGRTDERGIAAQREAPARCAHDADRQVLQARIVGLGGDRVDVLAGRAQSNSRSCTTSAHSTRCSPLDGGCRPASGSIPGPTNDGQGSFVSLRFRGVPGQIAARELRREAFGGQVRRRGAGARTLGVAGRGGSIAKRALAASPATASALSR